MRPEEDPCFNAPGDPEHPNLDPTRYGLPATSANVEALRTARAVEDFKDDSLSDENFRLRLFMDAAKSQRSEQKLAVARSKPKSNPLADALRVVAGAARGGERKLWPSVRDAMLRSLDDGETMVGGLEVTKITGAGFADTYEKRDLAGIRITFELDGATKTISAVTAYDYVMRR